MLIPYADTDMQKAVDEALLNKRITKNNKRGSAGAGEELSQEELAQEALIKEVLDIQAGQIHSFFAFCCFSLSCKFIQFSPDHLYSRIHRRHL